MRTKSENIILHKPNFYIAIYFEITKYLSKFLFLNHTIIIIQKLLKYGKIFLNRRADQGSLVQILGTVSYNNLSNNKTVFDNVLYNNSHIITN